MRLRGSWIAGSAFVAWSAVRTLGGLPAGLLELGTWMGAFGVAVIAVHLGRSEAIRVARRVSLVVGGGTSLAAITAFVGGGRGFSLHGGQGNPNWLGLLLAVCLPLSIDAAAALLRPTRRAGFAIALSLVGVEIAGLVSSHSRVAWCASLVAAAFFGAPRLHRGARAVLEPTRAWRRRRRTFAVGVVCAGLVVSATWFSLRSSVGRNPVSSDVTAEVSLRGRLHIARGALVAAAHAFPFGAGLGRFAHVFLDAQGEILASMPPSQAARRFINATTAHDDVLEAAVDSGPLAALLLIAFVVLTTRAQRRARWPAGAAATVAFGVTALGDSPLHQPAIALMMALVAAAIPAPKRHARPNRRTMGFALLATWALSACLLAFSTRAWLATRTRTLAEDHAGSLRLTYLQRSVAMDPTSGEGLLDLGLAELATKDPERAQVHLERSRALLANVGTDVALGETALDLGDSGRAIARFRAALAHHPGSLRARTAMADALRIEGRFADAEEAVEIAEHLAPGDPLVHGLADRIREERMDTDSADEAPRPPSAATPSADGPDAASVK